MVAVVVRENGDAKLIEESADHVEANVLPRARQALGIVSAIWTSDGEGGTLNVLVFDSEEAARAALGPIKNAPRPAFLRFEGAQLHKVLARF